MLEDQIYPKCLEDKFTQNVFSVTFDTILQESHQSFILALFCKNELDQKCFSLTNVGWPPTKICIFRQELTVLLAKNGCN